MQIEKKRTVLLNVWLFLLAIANMFITPFSLGVQIVYEGGWDWWFFHTDWGLILIIAVIIPGLNIAFGLAAWKRKKWGVFGLGAMSILASCLMGLWLPFLGIIVGFLEIIVLAVLVIPVWKYYK